MSTTPQRYGLKIDGDLISIIPYKEGKYILFTDHEADKGRAVAEVTERIDAAAGAFDRIRKLVGAKDTDAMPAEHCVSVAVQRAESTIATQQAIIARLTKAVERASELLEEVRTGEDFEAVCWEAAEEFKQMLKNPSP